MIKLAIVDDDLRLAKGLKSEMLDFEEIDSVLCCASGIKFAKDLAAMSPGKRPEVILMDISMGFPTEGIEATQQIKLLYPEIEIIMFTISDEDESIFEAFKAGAVGYLLKNESPSFIVKTILDIKNGGTQMSPSIARKTISYFQLPETKPKENLKQHTQLSVRETELLSLVSGGMTYDRIAEKLFISINTVKSHMTHIFAKLQVKNKVEALKKVGGLF